MSWYILYSKEGCIFCEYARQLFDLHDIKYSELKLNIDFTDAEIKRLYPGTTTYPRIAEFVSVEKKNFIGGYTELRAHLEANND